MNFNTILQGDALEQLQTLPDNCIDCCVTSPPYYGLRDYGIAGQIGLEERPEEYIDKLVSIFRELKRVLKPTGTFWLNVGDSYAGGQGRWGGGVSNITTKQSSNNGSLSQIPSTHKWEHETIKSKDLIGIPWMLAFALRSDGWYLRQDIVWAKTNAMPESVTDRCTKSHEYIFLLTKEPHYYFDHEAIQEPCVRDTGNADIKFGGNKYRYGKRGDEKVSHIYSGRTYHPKHKNLQYDGQTPNTMHKRRAEGLPDIEYTVRNKRDVWSLPVAQYKGAHFATFPEKLVAPCILAGCPVGGVVLDPFFGSGTVGKVAIQLNRQYLGVELNEKYIKLAQERLGDIQLTLEGLI